MEKVSIKIWSIALVICIGMLAVSSCKKAKGPGDDDKKDTFSYVDIGPGLSSEWNLMDARRSDKGLWAHYTNSGSGHKLARYDFQSKKWQFWDFDQTIWDFDVYLEGEDQSNGAVVIDANRVYALSSAIEWDVKEIDQMKRHVALGWGSGSASFTNWIGGTHANNRAVYQQTGTCCPLQWNKIVGLPSIIHDMWASSRQDGYVLVSTATQAFIVYGGGGSEITFGGHNAAIERLAWDTRTGIPYVVIDGILYKIEANPNGKSARAIALADLSDQNSGVTIGRAALDIRGGHAYVSYGAVVDLANGGVNNSSWIGDVSMTDLDGLIMSQLIASSSFIFTPPNDSDGVLVHINGVDTKTFEPIDTWIRVNSAL